MYRTLADASKLTAEFNQLLCYWAAVVVITTVVLWIADQRRPNAISPPAALVLGSIAYAAIASAVYASTVADFTAFRLESDVVVLEFAAPHSQMLRIPQEQIAMVLFGLVGKRAVSPVACYIKFELKSQSTYRSASFQTSLEACKALRFEITTALSAK